MGTSSAGGPVTGPAGEDLASEATVDRTADATEAIAGAVAEGGAATPGQTALVVTPPANQLFAGAIAAGAGDSLPGTRVASPLGTGAAAQAVRTLPADEHARTVGSASATSVSGVQRGARVVHVTSQQLPKGRVELSPTAYAVPAGCSGVTFWVTYTRGSVTGYARLRIEQGNGTETGREPVIVSTSNAGVQSVVRQVLDLDKPPNADPETWAISVLLGPGVTHVRLVPWEQGNADDTSTIQITLTAGSR
jgi:hypothetical protein